MRLILASASPRRSELLRAAGFSFDVRAADLDERVHPGERPQAYVRRLAAEKARAVQLSLGADAPGAVVIGADTTVVVNGQIFGKAGDASEAEAMITALSGRSHLVFTGVSVLSGQVELGGVEETQVFVRALTNFDVDWYVQSGEWRDRAGAYAIQGLFGRFIPRVEGSYPSVVGLPVAMVADLIGQVSGR